MQVAQGDDGNTGAHKSIVGVVPLGTLGIHPDSGVGDEIGQLGQQGNQNLFRQGDLIDRAVGQRQQTTVGSCPTHPLCNFVIQLLIEHDGVVRVFQHAGIGFDAIGHVGVAENTAIHQRHQRVRFVVQRLFNQLQQVDELVIAPVTDVRPGVFGFRTFPVDAVPGNPIGVIAVRRAGVDKLGDHSRAEQGQGCRQRLPVLKNIPPVALVIQQSVARLVPDPDCKAVPGA